MTMMTERMRTGTTTGERHWSLAAVALLIGAVAQILVPLTGVERIGEVADANAHRITPAGYAFSIWTPIFILAIAWAVWRLLPNVSHSATARRTDPWLAIAFLCNAAWEWVFAREWFIPAQVIIVAGLICGVGAFVVLSHGRDPLTTVERWILAPLSGLFLGWITAATLVGLLSTLVAFDVVGAASTSNALIGILFVVTGLQIASSMTMISTRAAGPPQLWVANVLAFVWALVAVVVAQRDDSPQTAIAAGLAAVALIAFAAWRGREQARRS